MARGGGGRGAIIANTFIKGGRLIEGRLLVDEIRYLRAGTPELLDMSAPSKRLFYFAGLFNNLSELELQAKVEV